MHTLTAGSTVKFVLRSASGVNNCCCGSVADIRSAVSRLAISHIYTTLPYMHGPDVSLYKDYGLQTDPNAGGTGGCLVSLFFFRILFPFALRHQGNFFLPL